MTIVFATLILGHDPYLFVLVYKWVSMPRINGMLSVSLRYNLTLQHYEERTLSGSFHNVVLLYSPCRGWWSLELTAISAVLNSSSSSRKYSISPCRISNFTMQVKYNANYQQRFLHEFFFFLSMLLLHEPLSLVQSSICCYFNSCFKAHWCSISVSFPALALKSQVECSSNRQKMWTQGQSYRRVLHNKVTYVSQQHIKMVCLWPRVSLSQAIGLVYCMQLHGKVKSMKVQTLRKELS